MRVLVNVIHRARSELSRCWQVSDLNAAIAISTSMDGSLFYHRGLAYYAKGCLGKKITRHNHVAFQLLAGAV